MSYLKNRQVIKHKCPHCPATFAVSKNLKVHVQTHYANPFFRAKPSSYNGFLVDHARHVVTENELSYGSGAYSEHNVEASDQGSGELPDEITFASSMTNISDEDFLKSSDIVITKEMKQIFPTGKLSDDDRDMVFVGLSCDSVEEQSCDDVDKKFEKESGVRKGASDISLDTYNTGNHNRSTRTTVRQDPDGSSQNVATLKNKHVEKYSGKGSAKVSYDTSTCGSQREQESERRGIQIEAMTVDDNVVSEENGMDNDRNNVILLSGETENNIDKEQVSERSRQSYEKGRKPNHFVGGISRNRKTYIDDPKPNYLLSASEKTGRKVYGEKRKPNYLVKMYEHYRKPTYVSTSGKTKYVRIIKTLQKTSHKGSTADTSVSHGRKLNHVVGTLEKRKTCEKEANIKYMRIVETSQKMSHKDLTAVTSVSRGRKPNFVAGTSEKTNRNTCEKEVETKYVHIIKTSQNTSHKDSTASTFVSHAPLYASLASLHSQDLDAHLSTQNTSTTSLVAPLPQSSESSSSTVSQTSECYSGKTENCNTCPQSNNQRNKYCDQTDAISRKTNQHAQSLYSIWRNHIRLTKRALAHKILSRSKLLQRYVWLQCFKCKYCGQCFHKFHVYSKHMHSHRRRLIRQLNFKRKHLCVRYFGSHATDGEVSQSNMDAIVCQSCGDSFSGAAWIMHYLNRCPQRFNCQYCGQQFDTKGKLRLHETLHLSVMPYKCPICSRGFALHKYYMMHVKRCQ